jgi:tetratricopeptide (TPR) repeat protein
MLNTLGSIQRLLHHRTTALDHHQRALRLAHERGVSGAEADALMGLGMIHNDLGDTSRARSEAQDALSLARRTGHRLREGQALTLLAIVDTTAHAMRIGLEALEIHCETGYRLGQAQTHLALSEAYHRNHQPKAGDAHREKAHALYAEIGIPEPDGIVLS